MQNRKHLKFLIPLTTVYAFPAYSSEFNYDDIDIIKKTHTIFNKTIHQSAYWFDGLFLNENEQQSVPETKSIISIEWQQNEFAPAEFKVRFKAKYRLPHLKNKVDLIFSDSDDEDLNQRTLSNIDPTNKSTNLTASLRLIHSKSFSDFFDSRVGISGGDVFFRTRYIETFNIGRTNIFQFEPRISYYVGTGFEADVFNEYSQQVSENTLIKMTLNGSVADYYDGIKWNAGIHYLRMLNNSSAIGLSIETARQFEDEIVLHNNIYSISARYRFNAFYDWMYFEVEPFHKWNDHEFDRDYGISLRMEMMFEGK